MAIGCTWDWMTLMSELDWFWLISDWLSASETCKDTCKIASEFQVPRRRAAELQIAKEKNFRFSVKVGEILWVHISHSRHSYFWSPGLPPIPPLSCTFSGSAGSTGSLSLSTSTPLLGFSGIFWSSCLVSRGIPSRSKNRFLRPRFSGHGVNPWIYPPVQPFRWNEFSETLKPELWVVTGWNLEASLVSCHQIWQLLSFPSHHII